MQQAIMFETEDLPLFSGTAPRGNIEKFDPCRVYGKITLDIKCKLCLDTGILQIRSGIFRNCWCEAGQRKEEE